MCNLAGACAILAAHMVTAGSVLPADLAQLQMDLSQPFVKVTLPREPVHLGVGYGPGLKQFTAQVNAHVVANCPYHLKASFQGLSHAKSKTAMSPKHQWVAINGKQVPVGTARVPIATSNKPTPRNGVDVPIHLQVGVNGLASYPAGQYSGILVITVMAGP